jgi:hypothetical protein
VGSNPFPHTDLFEDRGYSQKLQTPSKMISLSSIAALVVCELFSRIEHKDYATLKKIGES